MTTNDSALEIRKRVRKACDRCRIRKAKCDGSHPCSRCKADDAICFFGERRPMQEKPHPKGYVEMLEQQHSQLVCGLKEMYHMLRKASAWEGPSLDETSGNPLTHDILSALNLPESKQAMSSDLEVYNKQCYKPRASGIPEDTICTHKNVSLASGVECSHLDSTKMVSCRADISAQQKSSFFEDSFNFSSTPLAPLVESDPLYQYYARPPVRHLPPQEPMLTYDPPLYAPAWAQAFVDMNMSGQVCQTGPHTRSGEPSTFSSHDTTNTKATGHQPTSCQEQMFKDDMTGGRRDTITVGCFDTIDLDFRQ